MQVHDGPADGNQAQSAAQLISHTHNPAVGRGTAGRPCGMSGAEISPLWFDPATGHRGNGRAEGWNRNRSFGLNP